MFEVGRVCYKLAGRDANLPCVVVSITDKGILVDGATRRRVVNPLHIEPTPQTVSISENASTDAVVKALTDAGFSVPKKGEARKTPARQIAKRDQKSAESAKVATESKKPAKKAPVKKAPKPTKTTKSAEAAE